MRTCFGDTSTMDWESGRIPKRNADITFDAMLGERFSRLSKVRVVCNPAAGWVAERNLAATHPETVFDFLGLEINPDVHRRMWETACEISNRRTKFAVTEGPCSVQYYMRKFDRLRDDPFDYVHLDWMGTWSMGKFNQVITMLKNGLLARNAQVRLTMALSRGRDDVWLECFGLIDPSLHVIETRKKGAVQPPWKVFGVPALICATARNHGRELRAVESTIYLTRGGYGSTPAPEISFLFKAIR